MKNFFDSILQRLHSVMKKPAVTRAGFLLIGLASTVWFLLRVIPKPQRAAYPCMRAAAPLMSAFVLYLLSLTGSLVAFRSARENLRRSRFAYAGAFFAAAVVCSIALLTDAPQAVFARIAGGAEVTANVPVGTARGIFPGRVVWVHNPLVASWDGKTGFWWSDSVTSQTEAVSMLTGSLVSITGEKNEAAAWEKLFRYFNAQKHRGKKGYSAGEKIAVKINMNNTEAHANTNEINTSPQIVFALLRSMIEKGHIPQKNITVFDASRFITDNIFTKCHDAFPDVVFVDNAGGDGRVKAAFKDKAIPYSADNGRLAQGLAVCAVDADYLINVAVLKGHVGQGVTLCAKNYYGVTSIDKDWRKNAHNNFDQDRSGKPKYMTFVDFLGHKDLGEKTMLFIIDGFYGARAVNGVPSPKWKMAPFNGGWAASIFVSQDGVAIDAVGLDFLRSEWPDAPDMAYAEQYLIEAATANQPPSKTVYDPERDGSTLPSLGVFEHWNSVEKKQYSRNLGRKDGIELVAIAQHGAKK
jgi:uncharacterized protein (DUF362 family)